MRGIAPDVWHAHIAIPYGVTASLARWHPYLLTTHGSDVYLPAWLDKSGRFRQVPSAVAALPFRAVHLALAATVDRLVVYSPDMMEHLPSLGYPAGRLTPCFLGVDTSVFRPVRTAARAEDEFRIACTRHLEPLYDHATLLEAVRRLKAASLKVRLLLAGDGSARASLETAVRELGLQDEVAFLGAVPHEHLPELLGSCDVLVSPARSDTTALSVLEGMACGLPVVVTNVGSLKRRIEDGRNGFLFEPGDRDRLAASLRRLAADPEMRRRMGQGNAERAARDFSLDGTVDRLEAIYEDVSAGDPG